MDAEPTAAPASRQRDLGASTRRRGLIPWLVAGGLVAIAAALATTSAGPLPATVVVLAAGVVALGSAARGLEQPGIGLGAVALGTLVAGGSDRGALLAVVSGSLAGALLAMWADGIDRRRERLRGGIALLLSGLAATTAALLVARLPIDLPSGWRTATLAIAATVAALAVGALPGRLNSSRATLLRSLLDAATWALGLLAPTPATVAGLGLLAAGEIVAGRRRITTERRRGRELERLNRAGERLSRGPTDLEEAVASIYRELRHVAPIEWFHLEITARGREGLEWAGDPSGALVPGRPQPPGGPPPLPGIHRRAPWSLVEHELEADGQPLAVVRLWCDPRRLGGGGVEGVDRMIPQLGARLHLGVLGREAREDPLTGAVLRRVFERRLTETFERIAERGGAFSVALVDLDFFKRINDTFGHAAGDQALIHAAAVLRTRLRDEDLCARWGGEEFALLLDGLDAVAALAVVERLRGEIAALPIWFEGDRLPVTMSGGVAAFPGLYATSGAELLELADRALYAAKANGRNRVLEFVGPGRYKTPEGEDLVDADAAAPKSAPRIFA